jgi:hypothetical protein
MARLGLRQDRNSLLSLNQCKLLSALKPNHGFTHYPGIASSFVRGGNERLLRSPHEAE